MTRAKFIKTYANGIDDEPKLTLNRIESNTRKGIETLIVPDCNFLIDIEKLADIRPNFNILKERYEISEAVEFLFIACSKRLWVNWCPGFALDEMPPHMAQYCSQKLEFFYRNWEIFSIGYLSDETHSTPNLTKHEYDFESWDYAKQLFMAPSYISFILISILNTKLVKLSPQEKANIYINYIEKNINIFSAKEFLIALICFTNNTLKIAEINIIKKDVIDNFTVKYSQIDNRIEVQKTCANGARDLSYINSCNLLEERYPEKDIWFLTKDHKLLRMLQNASNMSGAGGTGELATIQGSLCEDPFILEYIMKFQIKTLARSRLGKVKSSDITRLNPKHLTNTIWEFYQNPEKLLQYNYKPTFD